MSALTFSIQKNIPKKLGRAGLLTTPHGIIETPAFIAVGTKATVKALTVRQLEEIGVQAVLGNTYHLFLEPGKDVVQEAGGIHNFMHWQLPTMTDSGGFQVFSLGDAFERKESKIAHDVPEEGVQVVYDKNIDLMHARLARIDDEGVTFTSHLNGTTHRLTPERSIEIQHALGADIIFAFDECTSPSAPYTYQKEAMERTHRWAERSYQAHLSSSSQRVSRSDKEHKNNQQALFGIVQGGRFEDLRRESAEFFAGQEFDGYGIGGSFNKGDLEVSLVLQNGILPSEKPRHLLGIGEPEDLFLGVESGIDTFDCVLPTRLARNGTLYTKTGKINISNKKYTHDFLPIESGCHCFTCSNHTKAYLAHLFRSREMLGATLASIHNLHFIVQLVKNIRQAILDDSFLSFKSNFITMYRNNS